MASRKHLLAVNRAIRVAGIDAKGIEGPMVEVLRDLARKMDAAGPEGPSINLLKSYLSATKDLGRAAVRRPGRPGVVSVESPASESVGSPPALKIVEESPLDRIRNEKKRANG